jgi:hypothetical protein
MARAALLLALLIVPAAAKIRDWLISNITDDPTWVPNPDGSWTLSNGLISRTFATTPGFGTVDFYSFALGASLLRTVDAEGYLSLDGATYPLGTLTGNAVVSGWAPYRNASWPGWSSSNASGWGLKSVEVTRPGTGGVAWTPGLRGSPPTAAWPPRGLTIVFHLQPPAGIPPAHAAVDVAIV